MPTYNNVNYRNLPQQVEKNRVDIAALQNDIVAGAVGPQGQTGPRGPQGIQGNTGLTGPAGANGTPVAGKSLLSTITSYATMSLSLTALLDTVTRRFIIYTQGSSFREFVTIYAGGVTTGKKVSVLDFLLGTKTSATEMRLQFYNEDGNATEFYTNANALIELVGNDTTAFTLYEVLNGSTVGPAGAQGSTGATGPQGATGPTGAQGIQGLPGPKNMEFLAAFENEDTFPEYAYRVMVQAVGGDYDGYTAIKEALEEGDSVKFGPYAVLANIENNAGTIQCILQNGVTSIRVYKVENI